MLGSRSRLRALLALGSAWALLAPGCAAYDAAKLGREAPQAPSSSADSGVSTRDSGHAADSGRPSRVPVDDGGTLVGVTDGALRDECATSPTGEFASCQRPNSVAACAGDKCLIVQCTRPFADCDHDPQNGCEATLDTLDNCGLCGAKCAFPHAEASCAQGKCQFERCTGGYGDCDNNKENGCEIELRSTDNCGTCGLHCKAPTNAAPGCAAGSCGVGECLGPFGDCDRTAGNGCEQPLSTVAHCGACDQPCSPPNATGNCDSGACAVVACQGTHVDCNGLAGDGCEATLDTPEHCGSCSAVCELASHATTMACSTSPSAACVVDHRCPSGATGCTDGAPEVGCEPGYGDCDGRGDNGCETRLDSLSDCGGCHLACAMTNAISACVDRSCSFVGCEPGFADCGGGSCASLGSDPSHCGACGTMCSGSASHCAGGQCTDQTCASGKADCNKMAGDGCEASLDDPNSCGVCGLHCGPYAHASSGCASGRCKLASCDPGYEDCDGALSNGCEVDVHTLESCGTCGSVCAIPFAQESCADGTCKLVQCDPGRADCDNDASAGSAGNGCESSLTDPATCGSCDNDCRALPNILSGGCNAGACEIVCKTGFGDCDGKPQTGCEAVFAAAKSCGACGNDCTALPHVTSASCNGSVCGNLKCESGYADCDGNPQNGCERPTNTMTDCGGCNTPCALAHAASDCSSGSCAITGCDGGYSDCNGTSSDGCEASLNDPGTCGSCSNACGSGMVCQNGACACTDSSQCQSSSYGCCDGQCVFTNSVCSLWPCPIPSTSEPVLNCGGCGVDCRTVGAFFCCAAGL
ncbi:MAG: hypothetical protein ACHQ53_01275 [Polyangiales bacterium]